MPGFDGTGPAGAGPMTGKGMGYCAVPVNERAETVYSPAAYPEEAYGPVPRFNGWGRRFGWGRGRGFGRGRGRGFGWGRGLGRGRIMYGW